MQLKLLFILLLYIIIIYNKNAVSITFHNVGKANEVLDKMFFL